jgi:hypothetical protein
MPARQLRLFAGRRQRGIRPLDASEFQIHCMVADVLRRWSMPDWRFTHIPAGEHRTAATAGRLKRMGVSAGWPDFLLVGPRLVCFLELKTRKGKQTEAQADVAAHLMASGCQYALVHSFNEALMILQHWGAVRTFGLRRNNDE